jgi:hypothetical protein
MEKLCHSETSNIIYELTRGNRQDVMNLIHLHCEKPKTRNSFISCTVNRHTQMVKTARHAARMAKMRNLYWNFVNPLTPNDPYRGRTAPITSKRCILYIYSTNIGTEYFKHGIYCPFFSLQNAVCFIIVTYLVPVLFIFYIQDVLKIKKNNFGAERLRLF